MRAQADSSDGDVAVLQRFVRVLTYHGYAGGRDVLVRNLTHCDSPWQKCEELREKKVLLVLWCVSCSQLLLHLLATPLFLQGCGLTSTPNSTWVSCRAVGDTCLVPLGRAAVMKAK